MSSLEGKKTDSGSDTGLIMVAHILLLTYGFPLVSRQPKAEKADFMVNPLTEGQKPFTFSFGFLCVSVQPHRLRGFLPLFCGPLPLELLFLLKGGGLGTVSATAAQFPMRVFGKEGRVLPQRNDSNKL